MEHSELFLLLPRYEDTIGQPDYIKSKSVMAENEILKVIGNIDEICSFIANENYKGYYDADNISAFLYPVETMEECYPQIKTRVRIVMNRWGENWRTQKVQKNTETYMYYCLPIKDDTLCEISERKVISGNVNTFLLVNYDAFSCTTGKIRTKRNMDDVELDVRNAEISSISEWYKTNRKPQRIFNLNPKHGENGKGAHPCNKGEKVSILMCSRGEAKDMLSKAIGKDLKVLYFFDKRHKRYIEFKHECNNIYHGFHLDMVDEKRVPEDIKAMISKLT